MRSHPHLYEINTWPWLDALSRRVGRPLTLGTVPDDQWDALRVLGIDLVYLMGIWRRSAIGRQLARSDARLFADYDRARPGWRARDIAGSAYSVAGHQPDSRVGTWEEIDDVREKLHARGMGLIVDFVGNHTGFDHPWMDSHPDRYVTGSDEAFRRDPQAFRAVEASTGDVRFVACGRDPYFPPWTDVAQLNYFSDQTRRAMVSELSAIAQHADGARCDMAMLALTEVFGRTWSALVRSPLPATEFWADARAAVPGFLLIAEVYWDLDWTLQQLGFDFTYDKRLYDRLARSSPGDVRGHLRADDGYQRRSVRFIENHDEPRSVVAFGDRVRSAAVVASTVQGLRFYHDGQLEGRRTRLPVQLGVMTDEPIDDALLLFYRRLLEIVHGPEFHSGQWRLLEIAPAGDDTGASLVAWRWNDDGRLRVVVVNLGDGAAHGRVRLNDDLPPHSTMFEFHDVLNGERYLCSRSKIETAGGLYVRLERGQSHIFAVMEAR